TGPRRDRDDLVLRRRRRDVYLDDARGVLAILVGRRSTGAHQRDGTEDNNAELGHAHSFPPKLSAGVGRWATPGQAVRVSVIFRSAVHTSRAHRLPNATTATTSAHGSPSHFWKACPKPSFFMSWPSWIDER